MCRDVPRRFGTFRNVAERLRTVRKVWYSVNALQMKHAAGLQVWRQRIMDCRASGQPVRVWCAQEGFNPSTYYRWEREAFGGLKKSKAQKEASIPAANSCAEQALVELPLAGQGRQALDCTEEVGLAAVGDLHNATYSVSKRPDASAPAFRPVAILRTGDTELSLTNEVSAKLMRQLKELLSHAE